MNWVINLNNFSRPHPLPLPMQSSEGVGGQRHVALIVQCPPFAAWCICFPSAAPPVARRVTPQGWCTFPWKNSFSPSSLPLHRASPLWGASHSLKPTTSSRRMWTCTSPPHICVHSPTSRPGGPTRPAISPLPRSAGSLPIVGLTASRVVRGWSAWISTMSILLLRTCREVSASLRKGTPWTVCDNNSSTIATSRPSLPSVRLRAMGWNGSRPSTGSEGTTNSGSVRSLRISAWVMAWSLTPSARISPARVFFLTIHVATSILPFAQVPTMSTVPSEKGIRIVRHFLDRCCMFMVYQRFIECKSDK